jgi:hypothetical protein
MKMKRSESDWIACQCMAEEDFLGEAVMMTDSGTVRSIAEIWGDEVRYIMQTYPEKFDPESLPRPIEGVEESTPNH